MHEYGLYYHLGDSMYYRRLRDTREDFDYKQKGLAAKLGISPQLYSMYERGERQIPFHLIIKLAKIYDVSIDYLAGLTDNARSYKD